MNKRLKFLIMIMVAVGLIFLYTYYSSGKDGGDETIVSIKGAAAKDISGGAEILKTLANLKSIKLDTAFFENEIFRGLIDFSVELTPEEAGRPNPFAPLE